MKKTTKFLSMAALALVGAMTAGCSSDDDYTAQQPESKTVTLTTTVSMDGAVATTRALSSTGVKTFAAGETMALVYKNSLDETVRVVSEALTEGNITNEGKSATFTFTLTAPDRTQDVTYIYPAAMAKADGTANFDALANQDGTLATLSSTFDYATQTAAWNGDNLPAATLDNQLAILAITLKDGGNDINGSITGLTVTEGANTYTVTRSAAAGPIYVAIQPTTSADITVSANKASIIYLKSSLTNKTYAKGNGYNISLKMAGAINGKFTVYPNQQVYFSQGNLQATTTDKGINWTWAFATNQYDCVGGGGANSYITGDGIVSTNGSVDLFGWSTATTTYGINNSKETSTYFGDFKDWGNTIGTGWRTLTSSEWQHVLNIRSSGSTVNSTANARYTCATINTDNGSGGVNGIILFPDDITIAGSEATTWGTINGESGWGTKCTTAQWTSLEAKGCVFLPAAGYRTPTASSGDSGGGNWGSSRRLTMTRAIEIGGDGTVEYDGEKGYYWTSTSADKPNRLLFREEAAWLGPASVAFYYNEENRQTGCSVRLVFPILPGNGEEIIDGDED